MKFLRQVTNRTLLKLVTENGEGEWGAAVSKRVYSGNQPEKKEKKREQFREMLGSFTVVNASFYRLCAQMTSRFLLAVRWPVCSVKPSKI